MLPKCTGYWATVMISEGSLVAAQVACNWFGWKPNQARQFRETSRKCLERVTRTGETETDWFAGVVSCIHLRWMVRNVTTGQQAKNAFWLAVLCQTVDLAVSG